MAGRPDLLSDRDFAALMRFFVNNMGRKLLTQERLRELFDYSPEAGLFIRKISTSNCVQAGDIAGTRQCAGYIHVSINHKKYLAHRLAFLYMEGYFPEYQIDHYTEISFIEELIDLKADKP